MEESQNKVKRFVQTQTKIIICGPTTLEMQHKVSLG